MGLEHKAVKNKLLFSGLLSIFMLSSCSGSGKYSVSSIDQIIQESTQSKSVEIVGFARVTGNMISIFSSPPIPDVILERKCVSGIGSLRQIALLRKIDSSSHITIYGYIIKRPDLMSNDQLYDVRIQGRTWYGSMCSASSAIFIDHIGLR